MAKGGKCKKCSECEECPEWIFTFADLVMLMMGFFVILWVLKPSPSKNQSDESVAAAEEKMLDAFGDIRKGFGYMPDPNSSDPIDKRMIEVMRMKQNGPGDKGRVRTESKGVDGTDNEVTTIRQGNQAIVGGRLLFDQGEAKITTELAKALDQIVLQIRGHRNIVMVKGHTSLDDLGDNATSEQKMDLSIRRAQAVADYLVAHRVEPDILRVQGCSTFEPVIQREYETNAQAMNRRVEVEATSTLVADRQDRRRMSTTIESPTTQSSVAPPAHGHE